VVGAVALAAGAGAAACRSAGGGGGAVPAPGGEDAPAAARSRQPVRLELWLPGRQADVDALEPLHRQFVAETPGAGAVAVQLVSNEAMMEQLTAALAGGVPPDVARLKEYRLADLGARGALLPLDRLVVRDVRLRLADFTPQSVDGSRAPAGAAAGAGGARGAGEPEPLLGLPDSHQLVVLFWNTDLVARAGIDPQRAPESWEALRRAAQAAGGAPGAAPAGGSEPGAPGEAPGSARQWGFQFYEFSTREQAYSWFMEWVWRAGGDVWPGQRRTRATLDTAAALRALQFQVDLLHADRSAVPAETPVAELISGVAQGRIAYWMTTANAALTYERTAPGLRFGVGPLPPDRRDAHQLQHNALSVFAASRARDAAYGLVSFRSREDVQARWAADGAWLPVRPALWSRPPFSQDERWRAIGSLVHRPGNRPKPVVPEWDSFTAVVLPPLLAAWRGEIAPRAALIAAEQAANAHLNARRGPLSSR
jgi:ABC-type glycerol-3-phosphate transport system substrate-binding protein